MFSVIFHRWVKLSIFWLVGSVLFLVWLYYGTLARLDGQLSHVVGEHLAYSMSDEWFSNGLDRPNDEKFISYARFKVNQVLSEIFQQKWYAAIGLGTVSVISIDDISIMKPSARKLSVNGMEVTMTDSIEATVDNGPLYQEVFNRIVTIWIDMHDRPRAVVIGYNFDTNILLFVALPLLFAGLLVLAHIVLPNPFSPIQRKWFYFLTHQGMEEGVAQAEVAAVPNTKLNLGKIQRYVFDTIYGAMAHSFSESVSIAADPRLQHLSELQMAWFLWRLMRSKTDGGSLSDLVNQGWILAFTPDRVVINLEERTITIRSVTIPVTTTPLIYYAWYAFKRLNGGDGWVLNPQSNRPDKQLGGELAELMYGHKGHAKAISDLEEAGLKAKVLVQNRSKVKEELVAVLGDDLAGNYLFEDEKDQKTGRMRYRLKLNPGQIEFTGALDSPVLSRRHKAIRQPLSSGAKVSSIAQESDLRQKVSL